MVKKLQTILTGAKVYNNSYELKNNSGTVLRALFDTEEQLKTFIQNSKATPEKQTDLGYFHQCILSKFGFAYGKNDTISINCFPIHLDTHSGLAVVEVTYNGTDSDKWVADFIQNFPNARKEIKHVKTAHPYVVGLVLEHDRIFYTDLSSEKRVVLSAAAGKIKVTFQENCTLSEKDRNEILSGKLEQDPPTAFFASKPMLDFHFKECLKANEERNQAAEAEKRKEKEAASGF